MNDPTTCPHPRFNAAEHSLCPDCDEHANDVERDRLRAQVETLKGALAHEKSCRTCAEDGCGRCWECKSDELLGQTKEPTDAR